MSILKWIKSEWLKKSSPQREIMEAISRGDAETLRDLCCPNCLIPTKHGDRCPDCLYGEDDWREER